MAQNVGVRWVFQQQMCICEHERPALTGVYAVKLDGLQSVANLGVRPTIAGVPKLMLEVHVLRF